MLVPIKWLYEFVPCDKSPKELAELFTCKGVEVNSITRVGEKLVDFVVAEVKIIANNKLTLFDGKNSIELSTPTHNLKPSDKIAFNPKESKLLTSVLADIGQDSLPIVLDANYKTGARLLDYIDDYVLDVEILPNRGDLMSVIGLARELACYEEVSAKFHKPPTFSAKESYDYNIKDLLDLQVDKQDCPDYIARIVFDVNITPSPFWLQWRMMAIGLRPINNIVDATNYIMVKYGTPLHAFDYDKLTGQTIQVRFANKGEKIKTIDGVVRDLNENVLLITDKKYPVALAGIMGGVDTEIAMSTKKVLIECARFNPKAIRRGSKQISLSTEASQRFEMGIDSEILETASLEVSNLIATLSNGVMIKDKMEIRTPEKPVSVKLSPSKTNTLLGIVLEKEKIKKILSSLGCEVAEQKDSLLVKVPSFRLDLQRDVDLIEEIGRIHGYDKLPSVFSLRGNEPGINDRLSQELSKIRDFFISGNFIECYTVSFCDEATALEFTSNAIVKIPNPLNERFAVLRPSILSTLLDSVKINYARGNKNLRLFEIGKVFSLIKEPKESLHIAGVMLGQNFPNFWQKGLDSLVGYFEIKGVVESFLDYLKIKEINFIETNCKFLSTNNAVALQYADTQIGYLGELKKTVLDRFDIPVPVYIVELDADVLLKLAPSYRFFQTLPRFPSVVRDFAFIVDSGISASKLTQSINKFAGALLENVEIFDYFSGKPLPVGKHNLGIRITLRSEERTLNQDEVNKIFDRILNYLKEKCQVELRTNK